MSIAALIVLATFLAYTPALRGEFIWDDNQYVRDNAVLRSLQGLADIWFDPMATPQYHPLVFSSFWVEYQLWGLDTLGYHLDNVALHAANALLLWRVLAGARPARRGAGRGNLCAAPGPSRVGGLDRRAQEHPVGAVLPGDDPGVAALRGAA